MSERQPYMKLKGLIAENGLSQSKVAKILGMSETAFGAKINGRTDFSLEEAAKLIDILHIDDPIAVFFTQNLRGA